MLRRSRWEACMPVKRSYTGHTATRLCMSLGRASFGKATNQNDGRGRYQGGCCASQSILSKQRMAVSFARKVRFYLHTPLFCKLVISTCSVAFASWSCFYPVSPRKDACRWAQGLLSSATCPMGWVAFSVCVSTPITAGVPHD